MKSKYLIRIKFSEHAERPDEHHYVVDDIYNPISKTKAQQEGLDAHFFYDTLKSASLDMKSMIVDEYSKMWLSEVAIVQVPEGMPFLERAVEAYQEIK